MDIKKLETLKIHSLTEEQYQKAKEEGTLEETAIYLTPDDESSGSGASSEELEQLQSQVNTLSETVTSNKTSTDEAIKDLEESNESLSQELADTASALEEKITKNITDITAINQSLEELDTEVETVKGDLTSHATSSNSQFALVREEFATQDTETLKTAKEYSDANKESAVSIANGYTDQKIDELVNGTGLEGVVDTIKDINEAMAESSDMMEALETANSKKVDKGSTIKPIYFDENGAQEIAHTIEKSVPADAKFTDTTYTLIKDSTNKKIQLMNGEILVSEVDDNNTTYGIVTQENPGLMSKEDKVKLDGVSEKIDDKLSFDEEIVNSENSVIKVIPGGSGKYAAVNKIGGMSYISRNPLEITATTQTKNGITYTVNGDGSVTAKGTATALSILDLGEISKKLIPGKTYKMSGIHACRIAKSDGTYSYPADSFTYTSDITAVYPYLQVVSGVTVNTIYFPMVIDSAETNTSFEKYYKGIRNAAVNKIISNPNLIDEKALANSSGSNYTEFKNGQLHLVNATGTTYASNLISVTVPKGTWYVNMKTHSYTTQAPPVGMVIANGVTKYINGVATLSLTYTFDSPTTIQVRLTTHNQTQAGEAYCNLWLTAAEGVEYKPYNPKVLEIPEAIRALEGYGLGINEDYYNYIDWERKVFVKRCIKVTGFTLKDTLTNTKYFQAEGNSNSVSGASASDKVICSHCDTYGYHTNDNAHFYIDSTTKKVNVYLPASVGDSVASEIEVIYALETPEETDISEYLPDDNFLEVTEEGTIIAVSQYNYNAPTEISFYTSESPEKVIVADTFVGDLVGIVEEAQSLTGLDSTVKELNYLHKNIIEEEGWIVPESGEFELDEILGATGPLGIVVGNSYTFTLTYTDGTVNTETITAIDASTLDSMWPIGTPTIQGADYEGIMIVDKVLSNENGEFVVGNNYYWNPPSYIDSNLASVKMTGKKADGTSFTHQAELYNKIPLEHLPDEIKESPTIQEWKWTGSDTGTASSGVSFQKPEGYNRCEIFVFDRKLKSSGSATINGTTIVPMCEEDGNTWDDYTDAGVTPANAKLGVADGTTTTGGTEWITTLKGECSFLEQGYIFTYHYGAGRMKTTTIASAEGAPPTLTGQFSCILDSNSDKTSILDSSLQWYLLATPEQNQGNYIKVIWYKD